MSPRVIIHSSSSVSLVVRVRNWLVFALSWMLWGLMILQLVQGIGRQGAATLQQIYIHWIDPRTAPSLGAVPAFVLTPVAVLLALLGWSQYQRRKFTQARLQTGTRVETIPEGGNSSTSCCYDNLCPVDVVSWYFGVEPRRIRAMQQARNVVIHHHSDGRVAAIQLTAGAFRAVPTDKHDGADSAIGEMQQSLARTRA